MARHLPFKSVRNNIDVEQIGFARKGVINVLINSAKMI
jgi:hypothetical protein